VIASHFAEAGLLVENLQAGLGIEPDDPGGLARQIRLLLDDPGRLENMGENAHLAASEQYSWDKTAERISSVCQQVIPSRS